MTDTHEIQVTELVFGLSSALDLVSQSLVNHHRQVFGFAVKIADAFSLCLEQKRDIGIAALLHDIGVVAFDHCSAEPAFSDADHNGHAELGYRLIREFPHFLSAANMVRHHHACWRGWDDGVSIGDYGARLGGSIVNLADQVAQRIDAGACVLSQCDGIRSWIADDCRGMFMPEVVEAFLQESEKEYFWLDSRFASVSQLGVKSALPEANLLLDLNGLRELSALFAKIIDYRSRHTSAHSRSVARLSEALGALSGLSQSDCSRLHVAGNLHDLGKLALPPSILDKPGALDPVERKTVKSHPYHTYRVLKDIAGLEEITSWASFHHECGDGSGYPFRLTERDIPFGAKIVAVADNLAALTEHRPYRSGLPRDACLGLMQGRALDKKLDAELVWLAGRHYGDLYDLTVAAQREGLQEYDAICQLPPRSAFRDSFLSLSYSS